MTHSVFPRDSPACPPGTEARADRLVDDSGAIGHAASRRCIVPLGWCIHLVHTRPDICRICIVEMNNQVSPRFCTDVSALHVSVTTGDAFIDGSSRKAPDNKRCLEKYAGEIARSNMTSGSFSDRYPAQIRIVPDHIRGCRDRSAMSAYQDVHALERHLFAPTARHHSSMSSVTVPCGAQPSNTPLLPSVGSSPRVTH